MSEKIKKPHSSNTPVTGTITIEKRGNKLKTFSTETNTTKTYPRPKPITTGKEKWLIEWFSYATSWNNFVYCFRIHFYKNI